MIRSYLNSPIVRRFINVRLDLPKEWDLCSETVNLNYVRIYHDLTEQYMKLLKSKVGLFLYTLLACAICLINETYLYSTG